ncbi:hypothetical protein [Parasitella parasitica]|uniref:TLC domain-containing protein n=1 Tax=Parasitella parasitica TaxID=35722 RepID=A0A0B7NWS1_9FUNG|nr:hypothetical protein [Parasitella parasitica]
MISLAQVLEQPIVLASFAASFLILGGSFLLFRYHLCREDTAKQERQSSWFLTFVSSFICTAVSIPFVIQFCHADLDMELLAMDSRFHTGFVCFFISYLILDLVLGSIYYPKHITLMTGWVHHLFYIFTLSWFPRLQISSMFTVISILELPTLVLAIGSMVHEWRSDFLFGSTFFVLRLVVHAWMTVALKKYHRIQFMWIVAVIVYPLHIYWFYGELCTDADQETR